jgi:hypothetical protein
MFFNPFAYLGYAQAKVEDTPEVQKRIHICLIAQRNNRKE